MTSLSKAKATPLSHGQQALWLIHQIAPESAAYNVAFALRVRSAVDVRALRAAFQCLNDRHAALRSVVSTQDTGPAQFVQEGHTAFFESIDVSAADDMELMRRVIAAEQRPFDLERGPITRTHLLTRSANDHVLMMVTHHMALDGSSIGLLLDDVLAAYEAERTGRAVHLPAIERQYTDYVAWEQQMLVGPEGARQREYWHRRLAGEIAPLNLPVDRPYGTSQIGKGATYELVLDADLFPKVQGLARQERMTLFTVLLSAFNVLLGRYTGQDDIIVGTPMGNRSQEGFHKTVGYFANMVALRTDLSGNPTVRELLSRVRETVLGALEHQSYPFSLLVQELKPVRDPHRTPVIEVMFNLRRSKDFGTLSFAWERGHDGILRANISGLVLEPFSIPQEEGRFDITLDLIENDDRIEGDLRYNDNLFDESTIVRLVDSYRLLLQAMAERPELSVPELPVLPAIVHKQVLVDWNATGAEYPDARLHELIAARAAAKPDAVAALFEGARLTYGELDRRANQLGHHLQTLGVGPEVLVGLCVERSLDMLVGLLGILKAGGAYVPLDPTYPRDRIAFMLADSKAPVLVAQQRFLSALPNGALRTVCLDSDWPAIEGQSATAPATAGNAECLAYVIYTSGSTGQPKGVQITHRALVNFLTSMQREPGFSEHDVLLAVTTLSFDIAGLELYLPLVAGGSVVVASRAVASDGAALRRSLIEHGVTVMQATPMTWHLLLEAGGPPGRHLKVLCGGEPLPPDVAAGLLSHSVELWNMYGPTETTIWSTLERVSSSESITVGRPIGNTQCYVLDPYGKPVPVGVVGELHIGGDGVARGYLDRPELTAERFVRDPFRASAGARLFKTGDRARYRADARLEVLGRADNQVKLRGYRIELGEIEAIVAQQPTVREVTVIVREDVPGDKRLVGYVTAAGQHSPTAADLRAAVREHLPDYMVPSTFVLLDTMPRTPNRKIDRRALPRPDIDQTRVVDEVYVAPETEVQRTIAQVWSEMLRLEHVGLHDNFFDLGGHSFLLLKVHQRLSSLFEKPISVADLFRFPNVHSLARHLAEQPETTERPAAPSRLASRRLTNTSKGLSRDIAIVGLAGRFPGARNVREFWRNVCQGRESVSFFSREELQSVGIDPAVLSEQNYIRAKGVIDDVEMFDAGFFDINPPEAEVMDPQHRIFLECAWEALEDANCDPSNYEGAIGVFAGASLNTYLLTNLLENPAGLYALGAYQAMIGNDKDYLSTRVSYKLNLRGPSMTVQTACSTSLVAVYLACQSLISGDSDVALAGAVSVAVPHRAGYFYEEGMILSPDGHCRPFDAAAAGTVSGEGCGIVVLKRLADALADCDDVYAVLKGISVNNDGSTKLGYTAPSVDGQASVIANAQMLAGASPETIGYVEAHGTGTPLGDPVEIAALTRAFEEGASRRGYCAIGSVKANIGHLDVAAGAAGLIKATLAVKHGLIPPSTNFTEPNPNIDFGASPFYVPTRLGEWPATDTPRRAGVSSFGIGGTNAHAVLEQAPGTRVASRRPGWQVLPLSARTPRALDAATARLADHLEQNPALQARDVAFTLQTGRRSFSHRRAVICADGESVPQILRSGARRVLTGSAKSEPGVVFMFSGQGSQYVNMTRGLYEAEAAFRSAVDACAGLLYQHLGLDLRTLIFPDEDVTEAATSRLQQTALAQPALFVIEYALAQLYTSWGVRPRAMIGHSIGEYVAACLAGVLSVGDALALVAARGKLMQDLPGGAMLSVPLLDTDVAPLLGPELSLAAINAPGLCVVAGPSEAIDRLQRALAEREIETRRLFTSHAFHSAMMEPAVLPFTERLRRVALNPPSIPFISNVTGDWITPAQATDPAYWARHMRRTVRFGDGIARLLQTQDTVFLEVGPGQTLATLVRQHPSRDSARFVINSVRHPNQTPPDMLVLLTAVAQMWLAGVPIDWRALHGELPPRRVSLPTYPFERERYWLDPKATPPAAGRSPSGVPGASRSLETTLHYSVPVWQQRPLAATAGNARPVAESWLVFLDGQGLASRVARRLQAAGKRVISVLPGAAFARVEADRYTVAPTNRADYEALLDDLRSNGHVPQGVLHCWSVTANDQSLSLESIAGYEERGFYSLLALVQAADGQLAGQPLKVVVISNDMQDVTGDEPVCAAKAILLGVTKVVPLELPFVTCQSVDVRLSPGGSSEDEQLAAQIAEEALGGAADGLIAYRGRHRWTQILTPIELAGPVGGRLIRPGGTYLITGGLGGIGLVLADYLAQQAPVNLVLIGRSASLPPFDWAGSLEHSGTHPVSEAVRALEKRGARVLVASADVSRLDDMEAVLKQVRDRFGAVHGVIHSAGISNYGMLVLRKPEEAARILAPKVRGTLVLDHLLAGDRLDFFVSCSSIAALSPTAGQIDYCGANAFLDAFAHAAATRSRCRYIAINWDNWREVGMAVNTVVRPALKAARDEAVAGGLLSIQGQAAFDALVHSSLPQALVTTKVAAGLAAQPSTEPGENRAAAPEATATRRSRRERPELGSSYAPPVTESERRITAIWQDLLGIEPVGIHDDFFELGGHSLLAVQLISRVSKTFRVGVSLRSLFDTATIADLAAQVDTLRPSIRAGEREELVL